MALIVVEEGANRGAAFPVEGPEAVLGRDLASEVPVYDERASRHHPAIRRLADGSFALVDLGSRNGTSVNGLPAGSEPVPLGPGDLIRIGATLLRFEPEPSLALPGATTVDGEVGAGGPGAVPPDRSAPPRRADRWLGSTPDADPCRLIATGQLVAESGAMRGVLAALRKAAPSGVPVLLTGESGTGKELCARALHAASGRAREPFVAVNCAALPETLLESELFGHERGAFTGAEAARAGLFELADRGTLFLDEVGECAPALQAKLLRALDGGEFRRLGGGTALRSRARILAATHRDLRLMVEDGAFREDLYFRLSVVTIALPPLRERPEDLTPLVRSILGRLSRERGRPRIGVGDAAFEALSRYAFPGNVCELRNALERAVILGDGRSVELADLGPEIRTAPGPSGPGHLSLAGVERRHIARVLDEFGGNKPRAAKALGIDRKTLYAKLAAYGLGDAAKGGP